jgi:hypothetical protein
MFSLLDLVIEAGEVKVSLQEVSVAMPNVISSSF